jgi:hypothetical protein
MTLTDEDGNTTERQVYLLIFSQGGYLRERINRVCDSFNGKAFELPGEGQGTREAFIQEQNEVDKRIKQMQGLISMTRRQLRSYLTKVQDLALDSGSPVSLCLFYK